MQFIHNVKPFTKRVQARNTICQIAMVRNVSSAVSVNEALELGLTACKTCKTAQSNSLNNFVQKKTKEQTNTLQ